MEKWWTKYLASKVKTIVNADITTLVQNALANAEGELSSSGALVVRTGKFTGRATEDKYVVKDSYSEGRIDWSNNISEISADHFEKIKKAILTDYNEYGRDIYVTERSVGADVNFSLVVNVLTPSASHSLFVNHIFRPSLLDPRLGFFTILHCPDLVLDPKELGLKSSTVIAINFKSKEILIAGTGYAGEIKKSIFSVMNTLLPDLEVLPTHAGANVDIEGRVSVFFGLSGTGKTTLSTDIGKALIGDDEHGISSYGIFNLEGGCYAKTYNLTELGEPQVYQAVNRFGALLENVLLDNHHQPIFNDKSLTENGRGSYPLNYISDASATGMAGSPVNIFFLSADAMGVLPAVAKLDTEQAMFYFLSGYTAKLAGTEVGLAGVKATFSHCFGAPFMMRHPMDYAQLLKKVLTEQHAKVWLINTGWYGGPSGVGRRYDLAVTRGIIRGIQAGQAEGEGCWHEGTFGLKTPKAIPGVDKKFLEARELWENKKEYDEAADLLKKIFAENFKKFSLPSFW